MYVKTLYFDSYLLYKLSKGSGLNTFGELAWPNDILYVFPIVILGYFSVVFSLSSLLPYRLSSSANPFKTPYEILPEWYLLILFNLLRFLEIKLIGVISTVFIPLFLILVPVIESLNIFQNPWCRLVGILCNILFLMSLAFISVGSLLSLSEAVLLFIA